MANFAIHQTTEEDKSLLAPIIKKGQMGGPKERCYGLRSPIMFYQSAPSNISGKHFSAPYSRAAKVLPLFRPAHTRGHIAGTCCSGSFPRVASPFYAKKFCCGNRILSPQLVAWNSAGLNSCVMKRRQNDPNFQCRIACTVPATCPHYMSPNACRPLS